MEADVKQFLPHTNLILNVLPIETLCPTTFCGKRLNKHWQRCNNVTMLHCILPRPLSFFVKDNRGRTCPNCCRVDNNADALLVHKFLVILSVSCRHSFKCSFLENDAIHSVCILSSFG